MTVLPLSRLHGEYKLLCISCTCSFSTIRFAQPTTLIHPSSLLPIGQRCP
ncbi:hypothetical protein HETIRDRAFT_419225 [Heterobasidion irregulare TC 32-1]|uniref:Uncharacterized protein n=1 Tax=Heterobasidion irregulare (strain TC 32-1) TaxID=747525 RepID=W4K369_HETIT|nr:uncharacterized protein HETIRDRAFT_419225 [Heterobasidion irregulare TC 32-1]ETW79516.1 hypothetical protein HETIRDRAFT_419225 [Heterobasidion irregulare TC 32-1]